VLVVHNFTVDKIRGSQNWLQAHAGILFSFLLFTLQVPNYHSYNIAFYGFIIRCTCVQLWLE